MPFSEEFLSCYAQAETAVRRQFLLRGYELGSDGQRLEPEAAVAFLEEHFLVVHADVMAATREEQHDLKRAGEAMLDESRAGWQPFASPLVAESDQSALSTWAADEAAESIRGQRTRWQTLPAGVLAHALTLRPTMLAVRKGNRRGVALARRRPRSFWERLLARCEKAAQLVACWEDGTSTILAEHEDIDWQPMLLPS